MEQLEFICCFTGHRTIPDEHLPRLHRELDRILDILIRSGVRTFRAGGALGFDTVAALSVLEKRKLYPHIRLELYLPCRDQSKGWRPADISIYEDIINKADSVVFLYDRYTRYCMHERNRQLVDGSDFCISYCTSSTGGTAYTVDYAKKKGVKITNLADFLEIDEENL